LTFTPSKFGISERVISFPLPINQEEINMANSVFMKAEEVQELLGVSRSESYRIMKKLNDDLKAKGFIVLSGRVSRKYLEEMIYGYPNVSTENKEEE